MKPMSEKKRKQLEELALLRGSDDDSDEPPKKFGESPGTFRMMQLFKQAFLRRLGQYTQKEANPYRNSAVYKKHLAQACEKAASTLSLPRF